MAECSRERQAVKQRERAPPAARHWDPIFPFSLHIVYIFLKLVLVIQNSDVCFGKLVYAYNTAWSFSILFWVSKEAALRVQVNSVIIPDTYTLNSKFQGVNIEAQERKVIFSLWRQNQDMKQTLESWLLLMIMLWLLTISKSPQNGKESFYSTVSANFSNVLMDRGVSQLYPSLPQEFLLQASFIENNKQEMEEWGGV